MNESTVDAIFMRIYENCCANNRKLKFHRNRQHKKTEKKLINVRDFVCKFNWQSYKVIVSTENLLNIEIKISFCFAQKQNKNHKQNNFKNRCKFNFFVFYEINRPLKIKISWLGQWFVEIWIEFIWFDCVHDFRLFDTMFVFFVCFSFALLFYMKQRRKGFHIDKSDYYLFPNNKKKNDFSILHQQIQIEIKIHQKQNQK